MFKTALIATVIGSFLVAPGVVLAQTTSAAPAPVAATTATAPVVNKDATKTAPVAKDAKVEKKAPAATDATKKN